MRKTILDTDVLIDFLRGREAARTFLEEVAIHSIACCSVISVAELYAGMKPNEESGTARFLDSLVILPVTMPIAEVAGAFKRRSTSRRLELADCLIAATALMEDAALATGNVKDYPMPEITVVRAVRREMSQTEVARTFGARACGRSASGGGLTEKAGCGHSRSSAGGAAWAKAV
jgi:predicted nucleic acid-binding protein